MLPELKGDPCWVFHSGPFTLEKRNKIRSEAGDRKFNSIIKPSKDSFEIPIFEFLAG